LFWNVEKLCITKIVIFLYGYKKLFYLVSSSEEEKLKRKFR